MATDSRIGVRYAKALFQLANEKGRVEEVRNDLMGLLDLLQESTEFEQLMESPLIQTSVKKRIFEKSLKDQLDELTEGFIKLLIKKKREDCLADICRMFNRLYKEAKGVIEARVSSVVPLGNELAGNLEEWLAKELNARIELDQEVDEEMIGGFVLKLDNRQMDASVSTQLQQIRNELKIN